jgi:hypothetical protein
VLEVDPEGAERVRRMFALAIAGHSLSSIAEELGVDRDIARRALCNRHYLGEVRDGRGGWHRGRHVPLVSPETWAAARTAVEARRLGGPRPRSGETRTSAWVLRTVARCTCGALMGAAWSGAREYLRCVRGCRPYVRVDEAEAAVEPLVLARLDELRELLARPSRRATAADPSAALERLAARRSRLAEAYELGAISREVLAERLGRLDEDERRLAAAPVAAPPVRREALAQIGAIRRAWAALTRSERREIVEALAVTVRLRAGHAPEPEWRGVGDLVV